LKATSVNYPYNERGSFECSDEMLDWVWEASRQTVKLCTYDRFMDNPDRERREYTADVATMVMAVHACFGDSDIIYKYLDDVKRGQPGYGLIPSNVLGLRNETSRTLTDGHSFVARVLDFYKLSGNKKILGSMFQSVLASVRNLEEHQNESGLLEELPFSVWIDWSDLDISGISLSVNATFIESLKAISQMAEIIGESHICEEYRNKYTQKAALLNDLFWNEEKGVYVDSVVSGQQSEHVSEHCNYLMILYGHVPNNRIKRILRYLKKPGIETGQMEALQFYPVEALFKLNEGKRAVEMIKGRYSLARQQGLDTVPEIWHLNGNRNNGKWVCRYHRCAAQSGGTIAAYLLSKYILGIHQTEPGFRKILIFPNLCGLKWAKGVWPSPAGDIAVEWEHTDKMFALKCNAPDIEGKISIPVEKKSIKMLKVNGSKVDLSDIIANSIDFINHCSVEVHF